MAIRLQFEADARKAKQEVASLEKSVANIDNTTKRATKTAGTLVSSFLLLGSAAVGLRSLTKAVDSFTRLNNRIALTTGRTAALVAQQQKLISVSKATRTSIDQTASLYSKLALNTNLSNKEALALTNTLQKAAKISGGTIQTTGAAITQLTQGLASGVLRGEELNSVLEGLPRVAQAIASELNVSVGQLRSIAAEGKLTAAVVQKALVSSAKTINTEFESINVTIGESLSLATDNIKEGVVRIFNVLTSGSGGITKGVESFGEAVSESLKDFAVTLRVFQTDLLLFKLSAQDFIRGLNSLSISSTFRAMINNIVAYSDNIARALAPLVEFTETVKELFYGMFMYVIGNSIYKDMVRNIIAFTPNLFKALAPIKKFTSAIAAMFTASAASSAFAIGLLAPSFLQLGIAVGAFLNQQFGLSDKISSFAIGLKQSVVDAVKYLKEKIVQPGIAWGKTAANTFLGILAQGLAGVLATAFLAIPLGRLVLGLGFGKTLGGQIAVGFLALVGTLFAEFAGRDDFGQGFKGIIDRQSNILFKILNGLSTITRALIKIAPGSNNDGLVGSLKSFASFLADNMAGVLVTALTAGPLLKAFGAVAGTLNPLNVNSNLVAGASQTFADVIQRRQVGNKVRGLTSETKQLEADLAGLNESFAAERIRADRELKDAAAAGKDTARLRRSQRDNEDKFQANISKTRLALEDNQKRLAINSQLLDGPVTRLRTAVEKSVQSFGKIGGAVGGIAGQFIGAGIGADFAKSFGLTAGQTLITTLAVSQLGAIVGAAVGRTFLTVLAVGATGVIGGLWKFTLLAPLKAIIGFGATLLLGAFSKGLLLFQALPALFLGMFMQIRLLMISLQPILATAYASAVRVAMLAVSALSGITMAGAFAVGLPLVLGAAIVAALTYAFKEDSIFAKLGSQIGIALYDAVQWISDVGTDIGEGISEYVSSINWSSIFKPWTWFGGSEGSSSSRAVTDNFSGNYPKILDTDLMTSSGQSAYKKMLASTTKDSPVPLSVETGKPSFMTQLNEAGTAVSSAILSLPKVKDMETLVQALHEMAHAATLSAVGPEEYAKADSKTKETVADRIAEKMLDKFRSDTMANVDKDIIAMGQKDMLKSLEETISSGDFSSKEADKLANWGTGILLPQFDSLREAEGIFPNKEAKTEAIIRQMYDLLKDKNLKHSVFSQIPQFNSGGSVYGAGTATSDSIPALLSNGEFVVKESVAKKYRGFLGALNSSGSLPRFNGGGEAGASGGSGSFSFLPEGLGEGISEIWALLKPYLQPMLDFIEKGFNALTGIGETTENSAANQIKSIGELTTALLPFANGEGIRLDAGALSKFLEDTPRATQRALQLNDSLSEVKAEIVDLKKQGKDVPLSLLNQEKLLREDIKLELAGITEAIEKGTAAAAEFTKRQEEAGQALLDTVKGSSSAGLAGFLTGEQSASEALTGIFTSIRDNIAENISTSFVEGLFTNVDGKDNPFASIITGFGSDLAKSSEDLGRGTAGLFGELGTSGNPVHVIMSKAADMFGFGSPDVGLSDQEMSDLGISGIASPLGQGNNVKGGSAGEAEGGFGGVISSIKGLGSTLLTDGFGGLGDVFGNLIGNLGGMFQNLFSGGGGAGLGGMLGTLLGGMFDNGGTVPSNKFGIVGERGPELVSGPAKVYNRAKTAREMQNASGRGGNITFALEGDFDSRAERSIRAMVQTGTLQSALNGAEIENGGATPVFRTP
jgi:tape measure domain-containing protein